MKDSSFKIGDVVEFSVTGRVSGFLNDGTVLIRVEPLRSIYEQEKGPTFGFEQSQLNPVIEIGSNVVMISDQSKVGVLKSTLYDTKKKRLFALVEYEKETKQILVSDLMKVT